MEAAGVKLVYSLPQIKVHSKIALVKKKVDGNQLSYAIISTGNFNEETARFYTDHVLLTSDVSIIKELISLFKFLEKGNNEIGDSRLKFSELWVSQFNMVDEFEKRVGLEIKKAKKGLPAQIRIKVNNLEEPGIINLLYKASKAGVKVDLIVRSVCCIVPGLPGTSEHITVRRIVDRFLEHSRLFIFGTAEDAVVYMGSSDLMTRNLYYRVEVCVPVKDAGCRKEVIDYFDMQWSDNTKAVELLPDQQSVAVVGDGGESINAQQAIYQYLQPTS
jgi:polyphosphate kinase